MAIQSMRVLVSANLDDDDLTVTCVFDFGWLFLSLGVLWLLAKVMPKRLTIRMLTCGVYDSI